jgi:hypothetical protein
MMYTTRADAIRKQHERGKKRKKTWTCHL